MDGRKESTHSVLRGMPCLRAVRGVCVAWWVRAVVWCVVRGACVRAWCCCKPRAGMYQRAAPLNLFGTEKQFKQYFPQGLITCINNLR